MPSLLDPLPLRCGAVLRNRLALAPLTNQQSHADGTLSEEDLRWLVRRAEGGFGLVSTCAAHVTPDGQGFDGQLGVARDGQEPIRGPRTPEQLAEVAISPSFIEYLRRFRGLVA